MIKPLIIAGVKLEPLKCTDFTWNVQGCGATIPHSRMTVARQFFWEAMCVIINTVHACCLHVPYTSPRCYTDEGSCLPLSFKFECPIGHNEVTRDGQVVGNLLTQSHLWSLCWKHQLLAWFMKLLSNLFLYNHAHACPGCRQFRDYCQQSDC